MRRVLRSGSRSVWAEYAIGMSRGSGLLHRYSQYNSWGNVAAFIVASLPAGSNRAEGEELGGVSGTRLLWTSRSLASADGRDYLIAVSADSCHWLRPRLNGRSSGRRVQRPDAKQSKAWT